MCSHQNGVKNFKYMSLIKRGISAGVADATERETLAEMEAR
jgi:hypothetical protein